MNENLNLVEILKDCPEGTKLYSPMFGDVELVKAYPQEEAINSHILVKLSDDKNAAFTKDGKLFTEYNGECTLFPSKYQRDWSKFEVKKPKFDPKTLQPFDRVLVRDSCKEKWQCSLFSYINNDSIYYPYATIATGYKYCIPYNDDTKYLLGTVDEAPEFYRYWEE